VDSLVDFPALARWLRDDGVAVYERHGKPHTTIEAINAALGVGPAAEIVEPQQQPPSRTWFEQNAGGFKLSVAEIVERAEAYRVGFGPDERGIYFLLSEGEIVYVGKSYSVRERLSQHWFEKVKPFDAVSFVLPVPEKFIDAVESFYVHSFNPPFNVQYRSCDEAMLPVGDDD
jgi:hypothetical protein